MLIEKTGRQKITSQNIQLAWWGTGLIFCNIVILFQNNSVNRNVTSVSSMANTWASLNIAIQTRFFQKSYEKQLEMWNRLQELKCLND